MTFDSHYQSGQVYVGVGSLAAVPQRITDLQATVGRPTHDRDDLTLQLVPSATGFAAPADLGSGVWVIRLRGVSADGTPFRHDMGLAIRR